MTRDRFGFGACSGLGRYPSEGKYPLHRARARGQPPPDTGQAQGFGGHHDTALTFGASVWFSKAGCFAIRASTSRHRAPAVASSATGITKETIPTRTLTARLPLGTPSGGPPLDCWPALGFLVLFETRVMGPGAGRGSGEGVPPWR